MDQKDDAAIRARVDKIRILTGPLKGTVDFFEAVSLTQSVLHDTIGGSHPLMAALKEALNLGDWMRARAASLSIITLYDEGGLKSPRLAIASEIEGELLDIAQNQAQAAEGSKDAGQKQIHLAIAAFLAGASLEDALRRLCDAHSLAYDAQRTSIAKLQNALYQPSKQIEVISLSENKQITAWGDTRNKADHGKFSDITHTEVVAIILGARTFIEKHLS